MWLVISTAGYAAEPASISLEEAESRAAASWSVRAAQDGVVAAEGRRIQARSALLPLVQVQGSAQYWDSPITVAFGGSGGGGAAPPDCTAYPDPVACQTALGVVGSLLSGLSTPIEVRDQLTTSLTVRAVQPLTGLVAGSWQLGAASQGIRAASAQADQAEHLARFQAADAWLSALSSDRQLDVARAQQKSLEARVARSQAAYDAEALTRNDLLQTKIALAQAEQAVIQATAFRDAARERLGLVIGGTLAMVPAVPPEEDLRGEPQPAEVLVDRALRTRPDLEGLRRQVDAAHASAAAADWGGLPNLSALAQYQRSEGQSFGTEPNTEFVGLNLDWNVWAWGRAHGAAVAAHATHDQAVLGLEQATAQVRVDIVTRRQSLMAAASAWAVARDSVAQAEESLRLFQARYEAAASTMSDVLDAEAARVRAESQSANAFYEARRAEEGLVLAVGSDPWMP